MSSDDLTRPLGGPRRRKEPSRLGHAILRNTAIASMLVLLVFGVWIIAFDDPLGGEPSGSSLIVRRAEPAPPASALPKDGVTQAGQTASIPGTPPSSGLSVRPANDPGGLVIRPVGPGDTDAPGGSGPLVIRVPGSGGSSAGVRDPDPRLTEDVGGLPLPRIGADGTRPSTAYARQTAGMLDPRPKVAVLVSGLGISGNMTSEAIAKLPPDITLAFAPYGDELERWASRARGDGHEYMLQIPMEPFDYPNSDPGPQTLLASEPAPVNLERLRWVMGRMQGYVGVTNYMGARFTAHEASLAPVLTEIGRRGLLFLDDGASPGSLAPRLAEGLGVMAGQAHVVIDGSAPPEDIEASLARLEEAARRDGFAIGVSAASPAAIQTLAEWSTRLSGKGLMLVPVSALITRERAS